MMWRGFPMVALATGDGKGRAVHLGRTFRGALSGTVCGKPYRQIVDEKVATGWPDCNTCIERVR